MARVEIATIADIEILDSRGEIGLRRLDEQLVVVCHGDVCMCLPVVGVDRVLQPVDSALSIRIVADDVRRS